jgi:hypothetical protein
MAVLNEVLNKEFQVKLISDAKPGFNVRENDWMILRAAGPGAWRIHQARLLVDRRKDVMEEPWHTLRLTEKREVDDLVILTGSYEDSRATVTFSGTGDKLKAVGEVKHAIGPRDHEGVWHGDP